MSYMLEQLDMKKIKPIGLALTPSSPIPLNVGIDIDVYRRRRRLFVCAFAGVFFLTFSNPALAYIGPGAGFAVGSTVIAFLTAFLSGLAAIFLWPVRWLFRWLRGRHAMAKAKVKRVVILGLDGMEPTLAEKYIAQGKMPNLSKLAKQGSYHKLATTAPPLSPVAWSSFLTGCNPGKHAIFDFLTREKRSYLPALSSVQIRERHKELRLGPLRFPTTKADVRLMRKGRPFWNYLSDCGIFSNIIRVPITFPPEPFRGALLSAMCVPDLRGSQGTFSYYSTRSNQNREHIGGEQIQVSREGGRIRSYLVGPDVTSEAGRTPICCRFEVKITGKDQASILVDGQSHQLIAHEYSPWITVKFKLGLFKKVSGICQFLLVSTEPDFELYVTPIQIDPDKPAMSISHPSVYSTYLSKNQGKYATLGLAEDTWGLNAELLDDEDFLHQCLQADEERDVMFFDALEKVKRGLCVCVFDGTDRIQHMFWRYMDKNHPACQNNGHGSSNTNGTSGRQHRQAIEELYERMDELVGRTMKECNDPDTLLMVISDHGFNSFRRGVDLNVWLEENGYLVLKPGGRGKKYLGGVDWSQTKAFCLGLAGIWLNIKGRESQGIVEPRDADALRIELCEKLTGLRDDAKDELAVSRALDSHEIYKGPYANESPDIIMGYNKGYRVSWEAAIGEITDQVFHDNTKAWSGDHCIDPELIPGVMFCSHAVKSENPRLMDLGPTVLNMFGLDVPKHMDGVPLVLAEAG